MRISMILRKKERRKINWIKYNNLRKMEYYKKVSCKRYIILW